jgi:hypothetical protein
MRSRNKYNVSDKRARTKDGAVFDSAAEVTYYLDLFAGIGGFALGAVYAGIKFDKYYFSEVDGYGIELYKKRFPRGGLAWRR